MQTLVTLPHISLNTPTSKRQFENFPPEKYPLCLNIMFSRHAVDFRKSLKAILDTIPKSEVKYRSSKNITTTFNCYCKSLESIIPVLNDALGQTEMYVRYGLTPDKRIFTDDLLALGQAVLSNN